MWARARLDIGFSDLLFALRKSLFNADTTKAAVSLEDLWSDRGDALTCFSVRSGFDLALQSLNFAEGSEILFSALNVKGMVKIARRQGYQPVPLDFEFGTLRPNAAAMEAAITPKTRALVIAPLFGTRYDIEPIMEVARRHDLIVFEDCAQAFSGLDFTGNDAATISMFSFGPLKFATALGGAIFRVRDEKLRARMAEIQNEYPLSSRRQFASRALKFGVLKLLTSHHILRIVASVFRMRGRDYEDSVTDAVRGVAKLGSANKIRKRCSAPLLQMMMRRVQNFTSEQLEPRRVAGRALLEGLPPTAVSPGSANAYHNFWAFPICVDDPLSVMEALRKEGFDAATLRRSQAIQPPEDRPELDPVVARELMAHLLVLPCYPSMGAKEIQRQAEILRTVATGPIPTVLEVNLASSS